MLFKHIQTGKLYKFVGYARSTDNPSTKLVVYKQLYNSKLRENQSILLPYGTTWTRERSDFAQKFTRVKLNFNIMRR